MSSRTDQIQKTKDLLKYALRVVGSTMINNPSVSEAKSHIRQAVNKLESVSERQSKKAHQSQTQFEGWWGDVVSGVAASPVAPQARYAVVKTLDDMISEEQKKLAELEKLSIKQNTPNQQVKQDSLLSD